MIGCFLLVLKDSKRAPKKQPDLMHIFKDYVQFNYIDKIFCWRIKMMDHSCPNCFPDILACRITQVSPFGHRARLEQLSMLEQQLVHASSPDTISSNLVHSLEECTYFWTFDNIIKDLVIKALKQTTATKAISQILSIWICNTDELY